MKSVVNNARERVAVASGAALDNWGRALGNCRMAGESDGDYRRRLLSPTMHTHQTPVVLPPPQLAVGCIYSTRDFSFGFRPMRFSMSTIQAVYHIDEAEIVSSVGPIPNFFHHHTVNYDSRYRVETLQASINFSDFSKNFIEVSEEEFIKGHREWKNGNSAVNPDPRKPTQMSADTPTPPVLDVAKGAELDKLGELYGLTRKADMGNLETDVDFRQRMIDAIKNINQTSNVPDLPTGPTEHDKLQDFFFPDAKKVNDQKFGIKCECGIDASGSGGLHSSWCPKHRIT